MSRSVFLAVASLGLFVACKSSDASAGVEAKAAAFDVRHEIKVTPPEGSKNVRVWMAYPQDDPLQTVADMKIDCPHPHRVETDADGNKVLFVEAPAGKEFSIVQSFNLVRRETRVSTDAAKARPISAADRAKYAADLAPNTHVVINDDVKKLAREITGGETNPVVAARKIYDWELQNIQYWVKDPDNLKASPVGSTVYTLEKRTGNCTDFH